MSEPLTIAVSKGRILAESLPLLARMGVRPKEDPERSRRLILPTNRPDVQLVIIRAADVPTFVQYGAAEFGIAGKDVLMEHGGDGLYEPVDLGIARCRMMLAGRSRTVNTGGRYPRVATKYLETTRRYFAEQGRQVELIKLYGSMELAPLVGLADYIVDLVDTGRTLRDNGLQALETIAEISSRLIVNRAAMKLRREAVRGFITELEAVLARPPVRVRTQTGRAGA